MSYSYLPDLPPETPNIWTTCDGFHPNAFGDYRSGWYVAEAISTAAEDVDYQHGYAYRTALGGAQLLLVHSTTGTPKFSIWDGSAWNDRYAAGLGAITRVGMVQVGNITLLGGDALVTLMSRDATGTSNFAAVASSPNATVLVVNALNIVLALNAIGTDAWATSDTNAPTTWTGGESASGNLRQTPGYTTTGVALGNDFIVFKDRGVYRGSYVGGTVKWAWTLIDPERGAWGPGAAVVAEGRAYFIGQSGFYSYDGASFERLDYGIWRRIIEIIGFAGQGVSEAFPTETKLVWDAQTRSILIFPQGAISRSSATRFGAATAFFSFNVVSKKWGYQSRVNDAAGIAYPAIFDFQPFNGYASGATTYNTNVGMFNPSSNKVVSLTTLFNVTDVPGTNYKPKLRTNRIGTRGRMTKISRVIPLWTKSDGVGSDLSTATLKSMVPYLSDSPMEAESAQTAVTLSTDLYRGDYIQSRRYQSFEFQINAAAAIAGVEVEALDAGRD